MGYRTGFDADFTLPTANVDGLINTLRGWDDEDIEHYDDLSVAGDEIIDLIFEELNAEGCTDNIAVVDGLLVLKFEGSGFNSDFQALVNTLAEHRVTGAIVGQGEDGDHWRLKITDRGEVDNQNASFVDGPSEDEKAELRNILEVLSYAEFGERCDYEAQDEEGRKGHIYPKIKQAQAFITAQLNG